MSGNPYIHNPKGATLAFKAIVPRSFRDRDGDGGTAGNVFQGHEGGGSKFGGGRGMARAQGGSGALKYIQYFKN